MQNNVVPSAIGLSVLAALSWIPGITPPYVFCVTPDCAADADSWLNHDSLVGLLAPCEEPLSAPIFAGLERTVYFTVVSWISLSFECSATKAYFAIISRLVYDETESKFLVIYA